jgi:hypothetical protein
MLFASIKLVVFLLFKNEFNQGVEEIIFKEIIFIFITII